MVQIMGYNGCKSMILCVIVRACIETESEGFLSVPNLAINNKNKLAYFGVKLRKKLPIVTLRFPNVTLM